MQQDMSIDDFPERSLRDLYYVVFRQKWKVLLFFLAVTATVTAGTFLASEIYRSEAKVLVQLGRESVTLDPTATTGQIISVSQNRENEINSELEILKSRELAEGVVDALGPEAFLERKGEDDREKATLTENARDTLRFGDLLKALGLSKPLSDRDKAIESVMKNLDLEVLKKSNIIALSYEAKSPELAKAVLDKLIDLYLERHITVHRTTGSYQFFANQSDQLRQTLQQYEQELLDLKNQTGIASLDEQRRILLERIGALKTQIEATDAAVAASRAKVLAMRSELAALPETLETSKTTGHPNWAADGMRQKLYDLELKEQDLLSRYKEDSIPVREIRRQIAEARALLDREERTRTQVTRALNEAHQEVKLALLNEQTNLRSLRARAQALKGQLTSAEKELMAVNYSEVRIAQLAREMEIGEANYRKYADNLEQARIDNALEIQKISNISIVQRATYPIKHIRPRKKLNLALGLFLGLLGGLGLAFFYEYMDHSFRKPEDVEERLRLPTLLAIPRLRAEKASLPSRARRVEMALLPAPDKRLHRPGQETPSSGDGQPETFWDRLVLSLNGAAGPIRSVAVSSCQRGEGVSTIAANFAESLARHYSEERILLVDVDPSASSTHQPNGTISTLPNLDFLHAGKMVHYGPNVYESRAFSDLLTTWKKAYAYVVFDVPPLNEKASGIHLAKLVDGVILVVEAGRTRWEVVQRERDQLHKAKANVLGVVLNKRQYPIPHWLYKTI